MNEASLGTSFLSGRASALLLLVFMMAALFTSVITAMLVMAGTQVAIHHAQEMHRSLADETRIKAMVLALVADHFETAPNSATPSGARVPPLNEQMQAAVSGLQGSGSWAIVAQPLETEFSRLAAFPSVSADKASPLSSVSAIADYLTPELHALIAGSSAAWTDPLIYQFRRTTEHIKDLRVAVRLLSFPLLRAPRFSRDATQNKIVYWQPRDLRADVAVADRSDERSPARAHFSFWRGQARHVVFAQKTDDSKDFGGGFMGEGKPLRDVGAATDLSLLSKYGERSIGVFTDTSSPGALPWMFRQRAALWIHAPGYIFSGDGLNAYLTYCGVTHTIDLQAFLAAPSSVAALTGVIPSVPSGEMLVDVSQLGDGVRSISGRTYRATRDAAVIYSETGGIVTLRDTGSSAASAFVIVLVGPADAAAAPLTVILSTPIARPIIFLLYHAELLNVGGPTSINGALYCDPASSFKGGAGHELTVASLTYYGANEALSHWNTVIATAPIPIQIEALAPRVILPVLKNL